LATERVAAAVEAARAQPFPFTLTARCENFLRGTPDLDDTIRRLQAYEQAGADVLFPPLPSLYRAAMSGLIAAAQEIRQQGTFGYVERLQDINRFMRRS
jgi:2-methylisocitrate lyase-like PEP mutase family enzyme